MLFTRQIARTALRKPARGAPWLLRPTETHPLVVADTTTALNGGTLSVITAAKQIGGDVTALVAGEGCEAVANEVAQVEGV